MSQSLSQERRAPAEGAITPSQSKDDIGALQQKFSRLEKELQGWNKEYNSSVNNVKAAYKRSIYRAFTNHFVILYDLFEKSKPEDTKKQEHEELVSAVQRKIDEYKKSIAEKPKKIKNSGINTIDEIRTIKANAIRGKPEEIKKLNGTPEGTQSVKTTEAKLLEILGRFESKLYNIDKQYSENTGHLYKQHKEIENRLNEMGTPKFSSESRAEAIKLAGSRDLHELLRETKERNEKDKRRELLEK